MAASYLNSGSWSYMRPRKKCQKGAIMLMINILHELIYQNPRNCGGIVFLGACRISIINSRKGPDDVATIPERGDTPNLERARTAALCLYSLGETLDP